MESWYEGPILTGSRKKRPWEESVEDWDLERFGEATSVEPRKEYCGVSCEEDSPRKSRRFEGDAMGAAAAPATSVSEPCDAALSRSGRRHHLFLFGPFVFFWTCILGPFFLFGPLKLLLRPVSETIISFWTL